MKQDFRFVCVSLIVQNKSRRIGTMSIVFRRKQKKIFLVDTLLSIIHQQDEMTGHKQDTRNLIDGSSVGQSFVSVHH